MSILRDNYGYLRAVWIIVPVIVGIILIVSLIALFTDDRCNRMYGQDFRYSPTYNASCVNNKGDIRAY